MSTVQDQANYRLKYVLDVLLLGAVILATPLYSWTVMKVGSIPVGRIDLLVIGLLISYASVSLLFHSRITLDVPSLLLLGLLTEMMGVGIWIFMYENYIIDFMTMFVQLLLLVGTYIAIINVRVTETQTVALVRIWVISAVSMATFGFYQGIARVFSLPLAYLRFNVPAPGVIQRAGYSSMFPEMFRIASVFAEPSWYAAHLLPPTVLCLVLVAQGNREILFRSRRSLLGVTTILMGGLIQSGSSTGYIALIATIAMYVVPVALLRGPFRLRHVVGVSTTVALVGGSVPTLRRVAVELVELFGEIVVWLRSGNESVLSFASAIPRLTNTYQTFRYWTAFDPMHLLFGRGLNHIENTSAVPGDSSINSYLQLLVDTGAIGASLFSLFVVYLFYKLAISPLRHPSRAWIGDLGVALGGAVFATAVILHQIGFVRPARFLAFLLAGLFLVTMNRSQSMETGRIQSGRLD
jgi:hypothetical protein